MKWGRYAVSFLGRIQKYERFSEILHLLELTKKVKFEANGGVVKVRLHERKTEIKPGMSQHPD